MFGGRSYRFQKFGLTTQAKNFNTAILSGTQVDMVEASRRSNDRLEAWTRGDDIAGDSCLQPYHKCIVRRCSARELNLRQTQRVKLRDAAGSFDAAHTVVLWLRTQYPKGFTRHGGRHHSPACRNNCSANIRSIRVSMLIARCSGMT